MIVIRDMTEARRIDEVRRDFVTNVSHELKTPVGALGLLADTIAAGGDESVVRPLAERIGREADRLAQIIDDLLDLSIIESQDAPARESVPVASLVERAVERARPGAEAMGVPLDVVPVPHDLVLVCDRRQVVSALTNLVDNAVKYSESGARVSVSASRLPDELVEISVADRGIGIPSRDTERIFERFYRVDRARSRATGGTGLGLSIVRHVAQAHGGEVAVESTEGVGSTFRFRIPMRGMRANAVPDGTPTGRGVQRG
jgi:two-component system sensor histidine kinase SenX3